MADYADASALVIKELTGEKRELRFTGRALPYRPLPLVTQQRVEVTWLPGAPHGTATVLGPTDGDTQINGTWKERFVTVGVARDGVAPPVTLNGEGFFSIADLEQVVDEFCRHGQLVEFTWGRVIRHGFVEKFERRWIDENDLEWAINFRWISRGEEVMPAVFVTVAGFDDIASSAKEQLDALDNLEMPDSFGLSFGFLDAINEFRNTIEDAIWAVTDYVVQFTNKVTSYIRTVRGIAATFEGLAQTCEDLIKFMEYSYGTELVAGTGPFSLGSGGLVGRPYDKQTEAEKLENEVFKQNVKDVAKAIRVMAVTKKTQMNEILEGDIIAQVSVQEGVDLKDLSDQFYGTPYEWRRIMAFNDMSGPECEMGMIVYIPKMNPEEAGASCPGT